LSRGGGEEQLTDELIGQVVSVVRPVWPDGVTAVDRPKHVMMVKVSGPIGACEASLTIRGIRCSVSNGSRPKLGRDQV
jgi:hypothetical protein